MNKLSKLVKTSAAVLGLVAALGGANAAVLVATDSTYGMFDQSSGTRTLNVGGGQVTDVNISITFSKCADFSIGPNGTTCLFAGNPNPVNSEIVFRLTNGLGTTVNLVNEFTYSNANGFPGLGRLTIEFDDEASSVVGGDGYRGVHGT